MFIRTPYNYDREAASAESALVCEDPSLAVQSAKDECDINTIVERFGLTGELPNVVHLPKYGDFTAVTDFQTAMNAVRTAGEGFMELPAQLRSRFHNDPQAFLEFVENPANRSELEKLGLTKPRVGAIMSGVDAVASTKPTEEKKDGDGDKAGKPAAGVND